MTVGISDDWRMLDLQLRYELHTALWHLFTSDANHNRVVEILTSSENPSVIHSLRKFCKEYFDANPSLTFNDVTQLTVSNYTWGETQASADHTSFIEWMGQLYPGAHFTVYSNSRGLQVLLKNSSDTRWKRVKSTAPGAWSYQTCQDLQAKGAEIVNPSVQDDSAPLLDQDSQPTGYLSLAGNPNTTFGAGTSGAGGLGDPLLHTGMRTLVLSGSDIPDAASDSVTGSPDSDHNDDEHSKTACWDTCTFM